MAVLEKTLEALDRCLRDAPEIDLSTVFDPSFLAQVPSPNLSGILRRLSEELGPCTGHETTEALSGRSARVRWRFERGYAVEGVVGVSEAEPHRVVLLNFGLPSRTEDRWEDIERAVEGLPGRASFEVRDLGTGRRISSVRAALRLGVGSTSKLLLFSCLLEQILAGRRRWDDLVVLEERHLSAPSGIMHTWPPGAPLTLHTAAALLILLSDNTAADLLLDVLGRDAVEATMDRIGVGDPALDKPYLSTRGLFRLVASPPELQERYRRATEEERRRLLRDAEAERPQIGDQTTEAFPEGFDWYLSASEVCTVLAHLDAQLAHDAVAKAILRISPGGIASSRWKFIGHKGGSSPGRCALAALLEDGEGGRLAACLIANAAPAVSSVEQCATVMKRATDLALTCRGGGP